MVDQEKNNSLNIIQSIDKAIDILCAFSISEPELGISEIASKTGLYKSTIFRILKTLELRGFVIQNLKNQKYRLGFKLFDLGSIVISRLEVRKEALPIMQKLSQRTRETVTLNIIDDIERVCIETVESDEPVHDFVPIGLRHPLYLTAGGKLLLAYLSCEEQERMLNVNNLGYTVLGMPINDSSLRKELELIVQRGYSFSTSERSIGTSSIAAPIFNYENKVIASIAISGPESRFKDDNFKKLVTETIEAAREISHRLGSVFQV